MKVVILFALITIVGLTAARSPQDELYKQMQTFKKNGGEVKVYTNFGSPDNGVNWEFENSNSVDTTDANNDSEANSNDDDDDGDDDQELNHVSFIIDLSNVAGTVESFLKSLNLF